MPHSKDDEKRNKSGRSNAVDTTRVENKRKTVKRILAGGGTILGANAMPDKWTKPLVQSVILPAHARTSDDVVPTTPATTSASSTTSTSTSAST